MIRQKIRVLLTRYLQDGLLFPVKEVPPCTVYGNPLFPNKVDIEIPIFEQKKCVALLRGVVCMSKFKNAPTLICAAGRSQNVEEAIDVIPPDIFKQFNVVLVNYRGYGIANGTSEQKKHGSIGKPSAKALESDILILYDYLKGHLGFKDFYAVGVSLGSAVITYLSKHRDLKGQLLIVPFDNIRNLSHDFLKSTYNLEKLTLDDVDKILRHKLDLTENMQNNMTPTHIIRAGGDSLIRKERTNNLIKHIKNLKSDITVEHAEHSFANDNPFIMEALRTSIGLTLHNFIINNIEREHLAKMEHQEAKDDAKHRLNLSSKALKPA